MDRTRRIFVAIIGLAIVFVIVVSLLRDRSAPTTSPGDLAPTEAEIRTDNSTAVTISMWTNDTKADWVNAATEHFNASQATISDGQPIFVQVEQLSSGDVFPLIKNGTIQPTIWSPGETSWINDANIEWQDLTNSPLTSEPCTPIVYTAIGISMWRPMAEALGWPNDPISWQEIDELAADPEGWAAYGHPEWGQFKFGHTHPDSSNTGFLAITSFFYAALGVTEGLTPQLIKSDEARIALHTLELNTYHYGLSSRSLSEKMVAGGPGYLSAATNSEIGVLATNHFQANDMQPPFTLVFVMPEGSVMWSDNPFCILDTDWVTEDQRQAANIYHDFLISREAQELAVEEWLRPADTSVPLSGDFLTGITDPEIKVGDWAVESVSGETAAAILDVFHEEKKRASVIIVLDNSASMAGAKHRQAIDAAIAFLNTYSRDPDDEITITLFNDQVIDLSPSGRIGDVGESLISTIRTIFPEGNTALYDAVCETMAAINEREEQAAAVEDPRLYAIVLLSDGKDTNSTRTESDMWDCVPVRETAVGVKIYTIAYGDEADIDLLTRLANRTGGEVYEGSPEDIEEILLEILYEQ